MVTFNYRLGIFGFLSTNDANAQGNWAMKDMIEALRWVRENIHHFGGNPNQITVFGESAGSVGVRICLTIKSLSENHKRLFLFSGSLSPSHTTWRWGNLKSFYLIDWVNCDDSV